MSDPISVDPDSIAEMAKHLGLVGGGGGIIGALLWWLKSREEKERIKDWQAMVVQVALLGQRMDQLTKEVSELRMEMARSSK